MSTGGGGRGLRSSWFSWYDSLDGAVWIVCAFVGVVGGTVREAYISVVVVYDDIDRARSRIEPWFTLEGSG